MVNAFHNILTEVAYDRLVTIAVLDDDRTTYKIFISNDRRRGSGDFTNLAAKATNGLWPTIVSVDFKMPPTITVERGTGSMLDLSCIGHDIKRILIRPPDNLLCDAAFSESEQKIILAGHTVIAKGHTRSEPLGVIDKQFIYVYADGQIEFHYLHPVMT